MLEHKRSPLPTPPTRRGHQGVAGDELMLSPRWSALAVRPSGVVEWHRSAGKSCSLDAHGEVFGEFGDLIGSDHLEGCVERSGTRTT